MLIFICYIIPYSFLFLCSISDIRTKKISLLTCLIYFIAGILLCTFFIQPDIHIIILNLIPGLFLFFVSIFTKGSIGMGDVIIFIILALYMPEICILPILFYSLLGAALFSIIFLVKKYSGKYALPFAPFITFGYTLFLIFYFYSEASCII